MVRQTIENRLREYFKLASRITKNKKLGRKEKIILLKKIMHEIKKITKPKSKIRMPREVVSKSLNPAEKKELAKVMYPQREGVYGPTSVHRVPVDYMAPQTMVMDPLLRQQMLLKEQMRTNKTEPKIEDKKDDNVNIDKESFKLLIDRHDDLMNRGRAYIDDLATISDDLVDIRQELGDDDLDESDKQRLIDEKHEKEQEKADIQQKANELKSEATEIIANASVGKVKVTQPPTPDKQPTASKASPEKVKQSALIHEAYASDDYFTNKYIKARELKINSSQYTAGDKYFDTYNQYLEYVYKLYILRKKYNKKIKKDREPIKTILRDAGATMPKWSKTYLLGQVKLMEPYIQEYDHLLPSTSGSSIFSRIGEAFKGIKNVRPIYIKTLLKRYGNYNITWLEILRIPIRSVIRKMANVVTLGQFDKSKKERGIKNYFHLYMRLKLSTSDGKTAVIFMEKNQRVNVMYSPPKNYKQSEKVIIPIRRKISLNTFINNAEKYALKFQKGKKLYIYDAVNANCQEYIKTHLLGSGLWSQKLSKFVMQKVVMPSLLQGVVKKATDAAHMYDVYRHGRGKKRNIYI